MHFFRWTFPSFIVLAPLSLQVRTEDRRRVDASLQTLTQRQADHARDFSQFSALVEQDLASALSRAKETAHAASAPQIAAALKLHVNATVAEAATAQEAALQRQEAQLRSLKAGIQGGPDASQVGECEKGGGCTQIGVSLLIVLIFILKWCSSLVKIGLLSLQFSSCSFLIPMAMSSRCVVSLDHAWNPLSLPRRQN